MSSTYAGRVTKYYRQTHERVLALMDDLSDDQFLWRHNGTAHSIAWTLWHLARWADHFQATVPRMTPVLRERLGERRQIWEVDGVAAEWGLVSQVLGYEETGMVMDDDEARRLALPDKARLLAYARRAFAAADEAVAAIDDAQWVEPDATNAAFQAGLGANPDSVETVGDTILQHLTHENRHLGEIECLRGAQGLRGTATQ